MASLGDLGDLGDGGGGVEAARASIVRATARRVSPGITDVTG
jgi:hypothetical protein